MKYQIVLFIGFLLVLGGCYQVGPEEGAVSTVPVTNNPNAMPGTMKTSPLPSVF